MIIAGAHTASLAASWNETRLAFSTRKAKRPPGGHLVTWSVQVRLPLRRDLRGGPADRSSCDVEPEVNGSGSPAPQGHYCVQSKLILPSSGKTLHYADGPIRHSLAQQVQPLTKRRKDAA